MTNTIYKMKKKIVTTKETFEINLQFSNFINLKVFLH